MHTHTCLHTHRQVIASSEELLLRTSRKPLGNREAVRKYREKKKSHAAFLEEEVKKLRATNQQLLRRLQRHASLEAEVRLRGVLFDVQGKINAEIRAFLPFEKHWSVGSAICTDPTLCFVNDDAEVAVAAPEESSGPTDFDFEID